MNRRKFVALTAAVTLGAALTACGNDDGDAAGDNSGVTLTMLMGVNNIYPEQQRQWFAEVSDKFKAETGATVRFETFASANDELTKIQMDAAPAAYNRARAAAKSASSADSSPGSPK